MLRLLNNPLLVELHLRTVEDVAAAAEVEVWSRTWADVEEFYREESVTVIRAPRSEVDSLADFWLVVCARHGHAPPDRTLAGARHALCEPVSIERLLGFFAMWRGVRSRPEWPPTEAVEQVLSMVEECDLVSLVFSTQDEHWYLSWETSA